MPCDAYHTRTLVIRYQNCNILPPKRAGSVPERLSVHDAVPWSSFIQRQRHAGAVQRQRHAGAVLDPC